MDMLIMWKRCSCQGKHTTNLFRHLHEHHPLIFIKLALSQSSSKSKPTEFDTSRKGATPAKTIVSSAKYLSDSAQVLKLNPNVTYYTTKDSVAIFTIEKARFMHVGSKLNSHYQILSKWYFADFEIPCLYSHIKDNSCCIS